MPRGREHHVRRDQAAGLRALVHRRNAAGLSIAVTSGKGGVGKSNIAVNLSIALSREGWRVVLVDADLGLANADLLMNLKPRYTLSHVLQGLRSVEEVCVKGPEGVRLIPGASGLHELADLSEFERQNLIVQLRKLDANTDIAVFDCGAGLSRNVMSFALAADRIMVITTPEPPALTDAYATIKALVQEGRRYGIGLFVNRVESRSQAEAVHRRVAEVGRKFLDYSVANFGYMLQDSNVELAVREQVPFVLRYPGCSASACIESAACALVRSPRARRARGGWLSRVAGLFV
ncbi:MAG: MinD/ParA family protein [Planctomycetota bacterium]|nr:MAG: MinD/ParA family protein [Planctomycetota bacterium]